MTEETTAELILNEEFIKYDLSYTSLRFNGSEREDLIQKYYSMKPYPRNKFGISLFKKVKMVGRSALNGKIESPFSKFLQKKIYPLLKLAFLKFMTFLIGYSCFSAMYL